MAKVFPLQFRQSVKFRANVISITERRKVCRRICYFQVCKPVSAAIMRFHVLPIIDPALPDIYWLVVVPPFLCCPHFPQFPTYNLFISVIMQPLKNSVVYSMFTRPFSGYSSQWKPHICAFGASLVIGVNYILQLELGGSSKCLK